MWNRTLSGLTIGAVAVTLVALVGFLVLSRPRATPTAAAPLPAATAQTSAPVVGATAAQPTAVPQPTAPGGPPAPGFEGGGEWLNSEPLTLAGLRGKVVLVDFWTYGCYNCQNTMPSVKQWWAKYKDQGLVIVGVHTPEFVREHKLENVQAYIEQEGIGWPIVQDNDYTIWRAYENRYWPHFYLVDHTGAIIYDHIGEGGYDETDQQIAAALERAKQ